MELERLFGEPLNSIFVINDLMLFSRHISPLEQLSLGVVVGFPDLKLQQLLRKWCTFYSHSRIKRLVSPPPKLRVTARA